ncbi:hypothetical protein IWW42_005249, partial [Coemansia sp. RSA 1085]
LKEMAEWSTSGTTFERFYYKPEFRQMEMEIPAEMPAFHTCDPENGFAAKVA